VSFEAGLGNRTSTRREFLSPAQKESAGCEFTGIVAKCDEVGGTLFDFEKEGK